MRREGVHRIGKGIRYQKEIDTTKTKSFGISLVETWIGEKQWEGMKDKLPQEFPWKCIRKGIEEGEMNEGQKREEKKKFERKNKDTKCKMENNNSVQERHKGDEIRVEC